MRGSSWTSLAVAAVLACLAATAAAEVVTAQGGHVDKASPAPVTTLSGRDLDAAATGVSLPEVLRRLPPPEPTLEPVSMPAPPAAFCSEEARVAYLTDVFNPAAEKATANGVKAAAHLNKLSEAISSAQAAKDILDARAAFNAYQPKAEAAYRFGRDIQTVRPAIMATPIKPCAPSTQQAAEVPAPVSRPVSFSESRVDELPRTVRPHDGVFCPMAPSPIIVGPNAKVGSGARTTEKLMKTGLGMLGGFIPGGGGGGSSGASDGPQTLHCRIKDSEMTVFSDPESGVSLKIGAHRSGDVVTVFAGIGKSPDSGTFQSAFLQKDDGAEQGPKDVGICELWGEWSLTVSWTKETYVNDQLVSRQEGGWSKSGTFSLPGVLTADSPQGALWKRLGFSNASHGAREIASQYRLSPAELAAGVRLIIHVTRPGQNPVTTVPFAVIMREGPNGITFEKASDDCPRPQPVLQEAHNATTDCGQPGGVCTGGPQEVCTGASCKTGLKDDPAMTQYRPVKASLTDSRGAVHNGALYDQLGQGTGAQAAQVSPPGKTCCQQPLDCTGGGCVPPSKPADKPVQVATASPPPGPTSPPATTVARPPEPPGDEELDPDSFGPAPQEPHTGPPPITEDAMTKALDDYAAAHPVEGAKPHVMMSVDDAGHALSGQVSYFSHSAEVFRATFDDQGMLIEAVKTADGYAFDTMKRFEFAYFGEEHGITASSLGDDGNDLAHIRHVSFTAEDGTSRGYMDFDKGGHLTKGIVYAQDGHTVARWDGPPDPPKPPPEPPRPPVAPDAKPPAEVAPKLSAPPQPDIPKGAEYDKQATELKAQLSKDFAAAQISRAAFDKRMDEVAAGAGPPRAGYDYAKISTSVGANGAAEDGRVHYFRGGFDLPIYVVEVDAAGQIVSSQALPGARIYQTLQGVTPGGHHAERFSYAYGANGRYVDRALIYDENGTLRADYRFGPDGVASQGETFGEDGHRTGVFSGASTPAPG